MILAPKELSDTYPVFRCHVSNLLDLKKIDLPARYTIVMLVADFGAVDDSKIRDVANSFVSKGNAYLCTWGNRCEAAESIWEEAAETLSADKPLGFEFMTTNQEEETLDEAVWFALNCAWVDDEIKGETAIVIATVGFDEWQKNIETICSDPDGFAERVLEEEGITKLIDPDDIESADEDDYRAANFGELPDRGEN